MFSKTCKYAIRAVLFLGANSSNENKMVVDEIAQKTNVPRPFLSKILLQLSKNKIISSVKGPNGGYYLDEENLKSNLFSVIELIDGPEILSSCVIGLKVCSGVNPCPYHDIFQKMRSEVSHTLKNESIKETIIRVKENDFQISDFV